MVSLEPMVKSVLRAYGVGFAASYSTAAGTSYLGVGSNRARATTAGVSMATTSSAVLVNDWMGNDITNLGLAVGLSGAVLAGYALVGTDAGAGLLNASVP